MNRKEFLKSCGLFGVGSCLVSGTVGRVAESIADGPPVTSCEEKQRFAQKWVKRFFDVFDESLDESAKSGIMENCGKACFEESVEGKEIKPVGVDDLISAINRSTGEIAATRDGNVVEFRYVGNPKGLKVADGYCLCPLVESGPQRLSGTYCLCSVGYVRQMFKTYTGRESSVELVESLKRGGKTCRFRITLA